MLASFLLSHVASSEWICGNASTAAEEKEWPDFEVRES